MTWVIVVLVIAVIVAIGLFVLQQRRRSGGVIAGTQTPRRPKARR